MFEINRTFVGFCRITLQMESGEFHHWVAWWFHRISTKNIKYKTTDNVFKYTLPDT